MDGTNQPKVSTLSAPMERVLIERDIATLLNLMHNFSNKWNEIGLGLGFVQSELTLISNNPSLFMSAPASFLRTLLSQWVQWPTKDHPTKPTLEALCEALRGSLVGLGSLAEQVERELKCSNDGSNGSASHPVGHPLSQPRVPQSGVTQAGVTQPGVPHPGVMQPGPEVPQRRVVQRGVTQLHNTPQHMAAAFRMSRRLPRPIYPASHSFHPPSQPVISAQPHQYMPPGFGSPGAADYTSLPPGLPPPHYGHSQPPAAAQFPMMGKGTPFQPSYQYPPYYQHEYPLPHGYTCNSLAFHNDWPQGGIIRHNFPQSCSQYNMPTSHASNIEIDQGPPSKKFKRTPSAQPPIGQIQLSTDMVQQLDLWRRKIADSYLTEESKSDAWPPLKIVHFVQLALVQQETRAEYLNLRTIKSGIDEIYGHKVNITYDNLFQNLDHSTLILIEGRPGSGKTTLLVRISCDWAKGNIARCKLIIFVRLRSLDKTREIYLHDLLDLACPALTDTDIHGLSSYIERRLGEDVVFMLDGFDEYFADAGKFICNLIEGKIFSRSTVILSSRPAATQAFRQIATQWIEVVGFMKEQVMQYIQTYYEHDKEKGLQLEQHLNSHTNVLNLCYLPIYCAMLVHLYERESLLPETETEFYRYFTLSSIFRTISKSTQDIDKLTSFDQLPSKKKSVFDKICHLAFRATVESRQVFEKSEILDICGDIGSINEKENPGLLVIDHCLATVGYDSKYSFLHLTLQEYLSAVYIAGCDNSEQVSIINSHSNKKRLYVMWRFLFGILDYSKESTVNLFKLLLAATRKNQLLHIRCAYESQHSAASTEVLQFHDNNLNFQFERIGHLDVACISYVLKTAEYTTIKLSFEQCNFHNFSVDDAVALLKGIGDRQLSLTVRWGEAIQSVLEALSLVTVPGLIELILQAADDGGVSVESNLKLSSDLHTLVLAYMDITNSGLEEELKHCPNLKELCIYTDCPLAVLEVIKHCTNLVGLDLGHCDLDVSKAQVLGQSLKFTSKLHSINLYNNPLGDDGLLVLVEGIKNCKELKHLHLQSNSLTDESIPHLIKLIESARNLEKLDLRNFGSGSVNCLTREGVEQIEKAVRERNSAGNMTKLELLIDEA